MDNAYSNRAYHPQQPEDILDEWSRYPAVNVADGSRNDVDPGAYLLSYEDPSSLRNVVPSFNTILEHTDMQFNSFNNTQGFQPPFDESSNITSRYSNNPSIDLSSSTSISSGLQSNKPFGLYSQDQQIFAGVPTQPVPMPVTLTPNRRMYEPVPAQHLLEGTEFRYHNALVKKAPRDLRRTCKIEKKASQHSHEHSGVNQRSTKRAKTVVTGALVTSVTTRRRSVKGEMLTKPSVAAIGVMNIWSGTHPGKIPNKKDIRWIRDMFDAAASPDSLLHWFEMTLMENEKEHKVTVLSEQEVTGPYRCNQEKCTKKLGTVTKIIYDENKPLPCTARCGASFKDKEKWKTHEKRNHPQGLWCCQDPACQLKPKKYWIKFRKEDFKTHLQKFHKDLLISERYCEENYLPINSIFSRKCLFEDCDTVITAWTGRLDHLAKHFREGPWIESQWRGPLDEATIEPALEIPPTEDSDTDDSESSSDSDTSDDDQSLEDSEDSLDGHGPGSKPEGPQNQDHLPEKPKGSRSRNNFSDRQQGSGQESPSNYSHYSHGYKYCSGPPQKFSSPSKRNIQSTFSEMSELMKALADHLYLDLTPFERRPVSKALYLCDEPWNINTHGTVIWSQDPMIFCPFFKNDKIYRAKVSMNLERQYPSHQILDVSYIRGQNKSIPECDLNTAITKCDSVTYTSATMTPSLAKSPAIQDDNVVNSSDIHRISRASCAASVLSIDYPMSRYLSEYDSCQYFLVNDVGPATFSSTHRNCISAVLRSDAESRATAQPPKNPPAIHIRSEVTRFPRKMVVFLVKKKEAFKLTYGTHRGGTYVKRNTVRVV